MIASAASLIGSGIAFLVKGQMSARTRMIQEQKMMLRSLRNFMMLIFLVVLLM